MPLSTIPITTLDAVNVILGAIGESPVSTIEENEVIDASLALTTLRNASFEVQSAGWQFNTDEKFLINPDVRKEIVLPANTLRVDTTGDSKELDLVIRRSRLYDRKNHTFEIDKPVTVDLVTMLDFEDLPSAARWYITIKASRRFQDKYMGDVSLHQFQQVDEENAMRMMKEEDMRSGDANLLTSAPASTVLFYNRVRFT